MLSLLSRPDLCCSTSRGSISSHGALLSQFSHYNILTPCSDGGSTSDCSFSPANSITTSTAQSRRVVVCHAEGRPMWARGTPEPNHGNSGSGGGMGALITREISSCDSVAELETVFIEYGGTFNYINAAAAITKYAKLRDSNMGSPFFKKLAVVWLQQLPESGSQGCANVLWACSKLGSAQHPVWTETWQAFFQLVSNDLCTHQPSLRPQDISNVLHACAKLRQQPQPDELLLLLEAFAHPVVLAAANSQQAANVIWSLGLLNVTPGWEAEIRQELLQRLLAPQMLVAVSTEAVPQHVSNVLMGLGRMCTGSAPLLSIAAAQGFARQLLAGVRLKSVSGWDSQAVTNTMWALGELQLRDEDFIQAAVAATSMWLPKCNGSQLTQAATACAQLQYRNEHFMGLLLQQGEHMLQPSMRGRQRPLSESDRGSVAAMCSLSVVLLDMRGLAGAARKLVVDSNIKQHSRAHPSSLRRLWVFHSWLLEHQLLDGKGLTGFVNQQQLQQGAKEAAAWGDKTRL